MALLVLVACATPAEAPTIEATLLEGASRTRSIDERTLVDEASDAALAGVLEDAGFAAATERTWTDRRADVWQTVVRALRFGSSEGAQTYLAWIDENASTLIGPATPRGDGAALAFEHEASDCCPNKDGPRALAAVADGELVWTAMLTGPAADAAGALALLPLPDQT